MQQSHRAGGWVTIGPSSSSYHLQEEILQMRADALNVKLGEEEEQSFQLFHPESAREIALQAKLMQATDQLDNKRKKDAEEEEEEAKRRREQDASDWASINVLTMAPIQEGMQSVPDSEVRSSGVATLGSILRRLQGHPQRYPRLGLCDVHGITRV